MQDRGLAGHEHMFACDGPGVETLAGSGGPAGQDLTVSCFDLGMRAAVRRGALGGDFHAVEVGQRADPESSVLLRGAAHRLARAE